MEHTNKFLWGFKKFFKNRSKLKNRTIAEQLVVSSGVPMCLVNAQGEILQKNLKAQALVPQESHLESWESFLEGASFEKLKVLFQKSLSYGRVFLKSFESTTKSQNPFPMEDPLTDTVTLSMTWIKEKRLDNHQQTIHLTCTPFVLDPSLFFLSFYPCEKSYTFAHWVGDIPESLVMNFFENTSDPMMILDARGKILTYNKSFKDLVPWDFPCLGVSFKDVLSPETTAEFDSLLSLMRVQKKNKKNIPIRFKESEKSDISAFLTPLDESAVVVCFLKPSEQENLQLQVLQSQKLHAMGELAGGIAHDFNNLLTAMIGFCDLLLMRHSPGDQSFTDIMQIKQNANRAANLVRQLLAFSRQQSLQPRKIDVTDNLAELRVLLQRLIGTSVELHIIHGRDLGFVKVDQGQLEQVIINLVVNARDAMPNGGQVTIRTHVVEVQTFLQHASVIIPRGTYVVMDIEDTGMGITPEDLPRIFDPFFTTKEIGTGTGLGLSTVYGIVSQMEGYIAVETSLGKGTTFKIFLPQYQLEKNETPYQCHHDGHTKDLTGHSSILLVEDEIAVRKFSARTLKEKGYHVVEAQNGREAYDYIVSTLSRGEVIDLLITDVVMPEMDGPELVEKAQKLIPDLKVIFISGYAESTFRHRLSRDGAIHFLPKPFNLKELAMKVKDITGGKSKKESAAHKKNVTFNYGRLPPRS